MVFGHSEDTGVNALEASFRRPLRAATQMPCLLDYFKRATEGRKPLGADVIAYLEGLRENSLGSFCRSRANETSFKSKASTTG
jgi:hypothetical protein